MNTFVSAATIIAAVLVAGGAARKVPLERVGDKTFYTVEGKDYVVWDEAVEACEKEGLKTAVVENQAESDALEAASLDRAKQDKQHYLWLGAVMENKKWVWAATGQELTYSNWHPDISVDAGSSPTTGYNCGYISTDPKWKTQNCLSEFGAAVCQKVRMRS